MGFRIGHGYDTHKLVNDKPLILCGEHIPYEKGLEGHSDSDVATHAAIDAFLGSVALGDIGAVYPDTDDRYKNANSVKLLGQTAREVYAKGYKLCNIDITIVAQNPHLRSHIDDMRANIAHALQTPVENVSVKATTEEGLGFTGADAGIKAHAVLLLETR